MKSLYKKLAAFQAEVPIIAKKVQGYGYKYADLASVVETIQPLLKKHGLGYYQSPSHEGMVTVLFDADSGEEIKSVVPMPEGIELKGMNPFQVDGSRITYYRRYALCCLLGLVADEDTDAAGEYVPKAATERTNNGKCGLPVKAYFDMLDKAKGHTFQEQKNTLKLIYGELVKRGLRSEDDMANFLDYLTKQDESSINSVDEKMRKFLLSL
mgnify:CR=1 FL=1